MEYYKIIYYYSFSYFPAIMTYSSYFILFIFLLLFYIYLKYYTISFIALKLSKLFIQSSNISNCNTRKIAVFTSILAHNYDLSTGTMNNRISKQNTPISYLYKNLS